MSTPLRLLIIEDRMEDVELMLRVLREDGLEFHHVRVETETDFVSRLEEGWDVILSDYSMPQFNAPHALSLVRDRALDIPFIVVTGSISEEVAVECMKQGAADYLLKDRLTRLGPAVRRALADRASREERREVEAQLRQSQKMEGLGRLAGGIAHDFNNLLTIICGYTEIVLARTPPQGSGRDELLQVLAAADRARDLTRQILAFSLKQVLQKTIVNVNREVKSIEQMLRRVIGEDVTVVTRLAKDLGDVRADASQIQQVLLNLAVNARDAMPQGGTLTIETANLELADVTTAAMPSLKAGEYVTFTVTDTGTGMLPSTMRLIFDPFFTTKPAGQGTGLGLATVFGIVQQHGGSISVTSEVGTGSTFRVYLPRTREAAIEPPSASTRPSSGARTGTILIVEDEAPIRTMLANMLAERGHRTLQAESPEQAESIAAAHDGPIDLLLTDIVLPNLRGTELHARLVSRRPEMQVLFMSGYSDGMTGVDAGAVPASSFLQKPFRLEYLRERIEERLSRA